MTVPSADGLDVLLVAVLLLVGLYLAWRDEDRDRRTERLVERLGTRREW